MLESQNTKPKVDRREIDQKWASLKIRQDIVKRGLLLKQNSQPESVLNRLSQDSWWDHQSAPLLAFYCPLCHVSRRLKGAPKPGGLAHIIQTVLTTAVTTAALSPWIGLKGVVSFIPFWIAFELAYRIRNRAQIQCGHCGFDPALFLVDMDRAKKEVERFWEKKQVRPSQTQATPQ